MSGLKRAADAALERHRASGRDFEAGTMRSFVLDVGEGEPVVLMHGVPASSFLYRKVAPELSSRGVRAIAFDLPGLGFADRPSEFDYSWTGLGRFAVDAVDALELERFHLVVHDIGGPVGFELAAAMPERVRSLTILNTLIDVDGFKKPWVMRPFGINGIDSLWLASMNRFSIQPLMWAVGVNGPGSAPAAELAAYALQLKRGDGGRAFLKIMHGFETTAAKAAIYKQVVADESRPVEIVWGERDTALSLRRYGERARQLAPHAGFTTVRARHFLQEDAPAAIADRIMAAAGRA